VNCIIIVIFGLIDFITFINIFCNGEIFSDTGCSCNGRAVS
jgi:hypothetical protein